MAASAAPWKVPLLANRSHSTFNQQARRDSPTKAVDRAFCSTSRHWQTVTGDLHLHQQLSIVACLLAAASASITVVVLARLQAQTARPINYM